jgi:hypothetical protein
VKAQWEVDMKSIAVLTILALGLAAPALAQSPDKPVNATQAVKTAEAAPVAEAAPAAEITDATPLDVLVQEGSEDRMKMLMRCVGPPPKARPAAVAAVEPAATGG